MMAENAPIWLDLGGVGNTPPWVTVNLDNSGYRARPNVVANISAHGGSLRGMYAPGSVARMRCIHTLEHLPAWDIGNTLRMWCELLVPGGGLLVVVPDLGQLALDYAMGEIPMGVLAAVAYVPGSRTQHSKLEEHRWGWDEESLREALLEAGFGDTRAGTDGEWEAAWRLDFAECVRTGLVGKYMVPNLRMVGIK